MQVEPRGVAQGIGERRSLGRSGVLVDRIGLGLWGMTEPVYGDPLADDAVQALLMAAWDAGIRTYDISPLWGAARGAYAEVALGNFLAARGAEAASARVILHLGIVHKGTDIVVSYDEAFLANQVDIALHRLGTGCVDVVLLEHPPAKIFVGTGVHKTLDRLKNEGKIAAWGVSSESRLVLENAASVGASVVMFPHNLLQSSTLTDVAELIKSQQLGVLARSPLCHGVLLRDPLTLMDSWVQSTQHVVRRWDGDGLRNLMGKLFRLRHFEHEHQLTPFALAGQYAFASPLVSSVVMGARFAHEVLAWRGLLEAQAAFLPRESIIALEQKLAQGDA